MSKEKRQDDIRLMAQQNAKNIARGRRLMAFDGETAGYTQEQAKALHASAERLTALFMQANAELTDARAILGNPEGIQTREPSLICDC